MFLLYVSTIKVFEKKNPKKTICIQFQTRFWLASAFVFPAGRVPRRRLLSLQMMLRHVDYIVFTSCAVLVIDSALEPSFVY